MIYLNDSGKKLTPLEIKTLECILSQGSFYEMDLDFDATSILIGLEVSEKEIPGFRRAIASLVEKNIITTYRDDNGIESYYINYLLEFLPLSQGYHKLYLKSEIIK